MIRHALLACHATTRSSTLVTTAPGIGGIVTRFAAGETTETAVDASRELIASGLFVTWTTWARTPSTWPRLTPRETPTSDARQAGR